MLVQLAECGKMVKICQYDKFRRSEYPLRVCIHPSKFIFTSVCPFTEREISGAARRPQKCLQRPTPLTPLFPFPTPILEE